MRTFEIARDWYGSGCNIYKKKMIEINPGVTVLVGCNGSGKTTLIEQMKEILYVEKVPYISFSNLTDGGDIARANAVARGDMAFSAESLLSSEGENIILNLGNFASKIGSFIRKNQDKQEMWIFLDAIDSGLSLDNIVELKELFKLMLSDAKEADLYIVTSANGYELAKEEDCFDVYSGEYIRFNDYEDYRQFILKSRERKNKRNYK